MNTKDHVKLYLIYKVFSTIILNISKDSFYWVISIPTMSKILTKLKMLTEKFCKLIPELDMFFHRGNCKF